MNKIKVKQVKRKMYANPKDLRPNPLNAKIYDNKVEEDKTQNEIANDFIKRVKKGLCPNQQPILIYEDGLIDAGHTRYNAALKANISQIWVEYTDKPKIDYDESPYSALEAVTSSNIYRKMTHSVKLNEFEQMNIAYVKEFGINRTTMQEDEHLKKLETSRPTIKKLQDIKRLRPDLMKLVDSSEWSVNSAWEEATGKNKVNVIVSNNPNRDWGQIYTSDIFKTIFNRVHNTLSTTLNISTKIDGDNYFPFKNFDRGSIAGIISHLTETIGSEVLKSEGHNVKPASGDPSDPDIYHIDIDDKVEIKVTNFNGSDTKWAGGRGVREGQYILVSFDETFERWMVIFTKLTSEDWTLRTGIMGNNSLHIKNVLKNHKNDMKVIYGSLYENNGKAIAQLDFL